MPASIQSLYVEFSLRSGEDWDFPFYMKTQAGNANKLRLPLREVIVSPLVLLTR